DGDGGREAVPQPARGAASHQRLTGTSAGATTVASVRDRRLFDVQGARGLLPEVRRRVDALIEVRADLTELSADLRRFGSSALGGLAEMKALQARLDHMLEWFSGQGIELKGLAPILVDFPAE